MLNADYQPALRLLMERVRDIKYLLQQLDLFHSLITEISLFLGSAGKNADPAKLNAKLVLFNPSVGSLDLQIIDRKGTTINNRNRRLRNNEMNIDSFEEEEEEEEEMDIEEKEEEDAVTSDDTDSNMEWNSEENKSSQSDRSSSCLSDVSSFFSFIVEHVKVD